MGLLDTIPEEKLPQCWSDDVRMNALFAPFRLKSVNPESWDMKMKFWSEMLRQWCRWKEDPIVSAADAKFAFQRRGRSPACLDIVVEEMYRNGELSPISKYRHVLHNGPDGWVRWGAKIAFRPAILALTAVSSLLPTRQVLDSDGLPRASIDATQKFVLESAVKDQAANLLQKFPAGVDRVGTVDELMQRCERQDRETFEILLGYLVSQGAACKKGDVVKLAETGTKASPITESDEALVKLLSAESRLEDDAARLSRDIAAVEAEARAALKLGNRLAAKNHLRRKHKLQTRMERCDSALENVRQLLSNVKEVSVNATIVDTYKTTSKAMRRDMNNEGLDLDGVHETMDDLKEVMETYNEVEKALGTYVDEFDASELEQELKDLLAGGDAPSGGTPGKGERAAKKPEPSKGKDTEREFVFDGEERVIAELNELSVQDSNPKPKDKEGAGEKKEEPKKEEKKKEKVAVTAEWGDAARAVPEAAPEAEAGAEAPGRTGRTWYPPEGAAWTGNTDDLKNSGDNFKEVRLDDRLHPGQPLNVDFSKSPRLYNSDFQVKDHKMDSGVWIYNSKDGNCNFDKDFEASTEYFSSDSPGKTGGTFQMAPGGERKNNQKWPQATSEESTVEDLERRLKNLRGFNL